MKMNYKKAILRFFLIMSAMFVVVVTTSGSCSKDSDDDDEQTVVIETCTEGYKIVFTDDSYKKAFVVGGKDGDKDRAIEVKFDQLTRANGFGAAMPEFKSLYKTMKDANDDEGKLAKENDGVIGFWGSYYTKDEVAETVDGNKNPRRSDKPPFISGNGAKAGLSPFILGLNIKSQRGTNDGSGEKVRATDIKIGITSYEKDEKPDAAALVNGVYAKKLTSGPAHQIAGDDFKPYVATSVGVPSGGTFVRGDIYDWSNCGLHCVRAKFGWSYTSVGRLENLPAVIDAETNAPMVRRGVFTNPALVGNKSWDLADVNKGDTRNAVGVAADVQNTYDHKKGWQKLFSIVSCDPDVKNGLIAAQLTKAGAGVGVANTLTAKDKLVLSASVAVDAAATNSIATMISTADGTKKEQCM